MSKARVVVSEDLTAEEARRAVLALLARGMAAEAHRVRHHDGVHQFLLDSASRSAAATAESAAAAVSWVVSVDEDEVDEALVELQDAYVRGEAEPPRPVPAATPFGQPASGIWTLRNSACSLAIVAVCVGVHIAVHGGATASRSAMIAAGAVAPWLVSDGQWWRLLSAVFLHFDLEHLVANMSALLFLGPPLTAQIGQLRTLVLFLATGIAGNLVSQLLGSEAAVKAGASGAICGLLGALAGVALGAMASATDSRERRPAWQTLGALLALFGMIVGVEPGRDHYAHVGGLLAGVLIGRLLGVRAAGSDA